MTAKVLKFTRPARLECSSCGATADAACECGVPYVPAGERAAKAVAANPEKSDRAIAQEIGVGVMTVSRARKSTVPHGTVEDGRVGKDGKVRKLPQAPVDYGPTPEQLRSRFLNLAWEYRHRPKEFDFPSMGNFAELAKAAERVEQAWSKAAKELRRLEANAKAKAKG